MALITNEELTILAAIIKRSLPPGKCFAMVIVSAHEASESSQVLSNLNLEDSATLFHEAFAAVTDPNASQSVNPLARGDN